jgi:hypothetical protein
MSAFAFHSIATQFRDRYLHPLQFHGKRSVEDRLSALENPARTPSRRPGPKGSPAPTQAPSSTPSGDVQKVGKSFSRSADTWQAKHSAAASDLLHTFNARMDSIQAQSKPSGGAWEDFHNAFNRPSTHTSAPMAAPHPSQVQDLREFDKPYSAPAKPSAPAPAAPKAPQRAVQKGLFGPSQVRAPQQFGLAASEGPKAVKPKSTAARKPRVTQPGLFPASAVKPLKK